jgi:putative ABC transport system permease protein
MWRWRRRSERDFSAEIQAHIRLDTDRLITEGARPEDARAAALRAFGNILRVQERFYESRRMMWLDDLWRDTQYAVRVFARTPGITLVAIVTLAIGIGATTAIVSAVNAVILKSLPYPTADRLIAISERRPTGELNAMTTRNYLAYTNLPAIFERAAATRGPFGGVTLTDGRTPVFLRAFQVGASYFDLLGAQAILGRTFVAGDDQPGRDRVVVLSHALWASQFGSDTALIGRPIHLDGEPYTVIGVMPARPFDDSWVQLWMPLAFDGARLSRTDHWLFSFTGAALGLLRPGVTLERARAELTAVSTQLAAIYPDTNKGWGVEIESYDKAIVSKDVRQSLYLLLGAIGLVMLLACVNLAHVLVTRGLAREQEVAIRMALGAGRGRIVRQCLAEALVLSVFGGFIGVTLAYVALPTMIAALPQYTLPAEANVAIDIRALVFVVMLSVSTGITCGLLSAVSATRHAKMSAEAHRRVSAPRESRRLQNVLVVSEVAFASVLLIGAGLLFRSYLNMRHDDGGITSANLLTAYVPVRDTSLSSPERLPVYFQQIVEAIKSLPAVDDVALTDGLPFQGVPRSMFFQVVGQPSVDRGRRPVTLLKGVSASYFRELGLRVRKGRGLGEHDGVGSPYVVVINETMARRHFSGEDPVGQHLLMQQTRPGTNDEIPWEVVGVIADERITPFGDKQDYAAAYVSLEQSPTPIVGVIVHTVLDPIRAEGAIRKAVFMVNKDQALTDMTTVEELKSQSMVSDSLRSALLCLFATIAVFLAAIGLFGVLSYTVERRTHEMGIRAALGENPRRLLGLVVRQGLVLTGTGLFFGLLGAFGFTRLLAAFLFGVGPSDPTTTVAAMSILAVVAAMACYVPAHRVTKVDPMVALRCE